MVTVLQSFLSNRWQMLVFCAWVGNMKLCIVGMEVIIYQEKTKARCQCLSLF
jgi:hypothetical protein